MKAIGLDIGTTTICVVVLDGETGDVVESRTVANDTFLNSNHAYEKTQDADCILVKVNKIIQQLIEIHGHIDSIGVTGQMHGILYVNKEGNAISPLYTWQDGRGDLLYTSEETYAQCLTKKTGYNMSSGFGLTTHFYNLCNDLVPKDASNICTIGDYVAMKMVNEVAPVMSPSNAASFGCFKLKDSVFDFESLEKANIECDILPSIKQGYNLVGKTKEGIPVSVAIGDNQASVLGSVQDMQNTVLVNVGTGSQVSVGVIGYIDNQSCTDIQLRPCVGHEFILVGSSLCGGRSYAMLEGFFRKVMMLNPDNTCESLYDVMDKVMSEETINEANLIIATRFSGTRENPIERGSISNIDINNFTPVNMMVGMLQGIASELFNLYDRMCEIKGIKASVLVGSGNGIRRNKHLQRIFEELFKLKLKIPAHDEEASYGAALFSLVASGEYENINEAQKVIKYL
ncbi:sedoheptulokinase [Clostridium sp.]